MFKQWGTWCPHTDWAKPQSITPDMVKCVYKTGELKDIDKCKVSLSNIWRDPNTRYVQKLENRESDYVVMYKAGKHRSGRTLDDKIHDEYPEVKL